jgi:hypothetical protein
MFRLSYYVFVVAAANGARLPPRDNYGARTTVGAAAQASDTVSWPYVPPSGLAQSSQLPIEWVYITEYTTVYATPTSGVQGTINATTTLTSKTATCVGRSSKSDKLSGSSTSTVSWLQYGPGLPGPAPSSNPYNASILTPNPLAPAGPTNVPPSSSSYVPTTSYISFPVYSSSPSAIQSQRPESSTELVIVPITPSMPVESSTAIVIVPIDPTQYTISDIHLARATHVHHQGFQQLDEGSALRQRNDADTNALHSESDKHSTTTRTTTLETTMTTDKLPSFVLVSRTRRSATSTHTSANISSKASSKKPTVTHTPSPTSGHYDSEDAVITSIIPLNHHCPYPYPGGVCGPPKTTLLTKTKPDTPLTTAKQDKPKYSGWCAYPGQMC